MKKDSKKKKKLATSTYLQTGRIFEDSQIYRKHLIDSQKVTRKECYSDFCVLYLYTRKSLKYM